MHHLRRFLFQDLPTLFNNSQPSGNLIGPVHEANKPVRMLGAIQDIDRQKTYSQLLEKQNEQLKQLAWLNSHEIRRPLCNITGLVPLMQSAVDDPDTMASLISMIKQSSDELGASIARINETAEADVALS